MLKTLTVVKIFRKFRVYLVGIELTVITACIALKTTSTKKGIIPRITRWCMQLQELTFTESKKLF